MTNRQPIAFLSYVRSDDDHDDGRITAFRKRLEGEVRMQTGDDFAIFQDRNDIMWGQHWEERISKSLSDVTFLVPIITPSFFKSPACRMEFTTFALKEKTLGINRLILPLYYVACDELAAEAKKGTDEIVDIVKARNWTDWRQFRFKSLSDEKAALALADMASAIKATISEINSINALIAAKPIEATSLPDGLPATIPEEEIPSSGEIEFADEPNSEEPLYEVPELRPAGNTPAWRPDSQPDSYHAYTRRFDEVVEASNFAERSELLKLYKYVGSFSRALRKINGPSLTPFLSQFTLKSENSSLAVSLLIDNSGSMRGPKIVHTAAWCTIITEWMNRLRIPIEVLGFTTRAWKGGQSRESWLADGKPRNPGRLNDLRHLIYKSFDSDIETSSLNFGAMVREGLLKENIDGEALLWAAARLEQRPEPKKILFVISDGAPVDDSTLLANPGNFLEKHLLSVIDSLSTKLRLHAIGIGHDVSRYYPNASTALEASELGPRFFEALVNDPSFANSFAARDPKPRYRFS